MIEPEHARFAPSSAPIYGPGGCAGSVAMRERYPEDEESEEAREGTAAHWLLEQTALGLTVPADAIAPNGVPVNAEMREAIAELIADFRDTIARAQRGDYYQIEQRVAAPTIIHKDFWGTPDLFFVQHSTKTLHIWDFKYGRRFVDVYKCWQLIGYFACIVETEQIADWQNWTVTFTIAQPRCFVRDEIGGPLREWFTTGAELAPLVDQLREAVALADQPDAPCKPGLYCRDCRAQWDCEANQRSTMSAVELIHGQQALGMDPLAIGLELLTLARAAERVKARLEALEAVALGLIGRGQNVPHHGVKFSETRVLWDKSKQAEAAQICAMFGLEVIPGISIPSPAQCIKAGVDASVITPYTTKAPGAKKLARVSDTSAPKVLGRR